MAIVDLSKRLLRWGCIMGVMLIAMMLLSAKPVSAASEDWGKTARIGKYYMRFNYSSYHLYISRKKKTDYMYTPVDHPCYVSNGKQILYASYDGYCYIKSYDIAKQKVKTLKKLPGYGEWTLSGLKGKYLWVQNVLNGKQKLYRYNIKSKKLKLYKEDSWLFHLSGKYYLHSYGKTKDFTYQDSNSFYTRLTTKRSICTLTKSGRLKTVRRLGYVDGMRDYYITYFKNWGNIKVLYYAKNKSHDLYRINANGKKRKRLKRFAGTIIDINKKSCKVTTDGGYKKYKY